MKRSIQLLLLLFIIISCGKEEDDPIIEPELTIEEEFLVSVNKHRNSIDLESLEICEPCIKEALIHSQNMSDSTVEFGHDGFQERFDAIVESTGASSVGENVGAGFLTVEEMMGAWLDSQTHRDNIEGDFTHMGMGIVEDADGQPYYTQIFAKI